MKARLTQIWARRPRLSRGQRAAGNLILACVLALGALTCLRPINLTCGQALRQMERQLLLSPGRTLCLEEDGDGTWGKTAFVLGDTYAYTAQVGNRDLGRSLVGQRAVLTGRVPLEGEITLLPLTGRSLGTGLRWEGKFFCPRGPEGASVARLTLTCQYRLTTSHDPGASATREEQTGVLELRGRAEADELGVYVFSLKAADERQAMVLCQLLGGWGRIQGEDGSWEQTCVLTRADYQLDFYTGDGAPRGQTQGELDLSHQVGG